MDLQKKLNDIFAEIDTAKDSIKKMEEEHKANIQAKAKKVKEDLKILRQLLTNNRFLDYSTSFFSGNSYHNGILIPLPYVYTHKDYKNNEIKEQIYVHFRYDDKSELVCSENVREGFSEDYHFKEIYEQIMYDWNEKKLFDVLKNQILQMAIDKATETLNQTLKTNADLQEKLKKDKALL